MTLLGMEPLGSRGPMRRVHEYRLDRMIAFLHTLPNPRRQRRLLDLLLGRGYDVAFLRLTSEELGQYQEFLVTYLREQVRRKLDDSR